MAQSMPVAADKALRDAGALLRTAASRSDG
jgi:hypothetical protein